MGSRSSLHPRVAKQQLNQHLGDVLAPVGEEIKNAFEAHLPRSGGQSFQSSSTLMDGHFLMQNFRLDRSGRSGSVRPDRGPCI